MLPDPQHLLLSGSSLAFGAIPPFLQDPGGFQGSETVADVLSLLAKCREKLAPSG